MINEPVPLTADSFQEAWVSVARMLAQCGWEARNLVAHVRNPNLLDDTLHTQVSDFADREGLLGPKHVAYTIFPHGLYRGNGDAATVFERYNRNDGMYDRLHRRKPDWGTYFRRMTHYDNAGPVVNQLDNIIQAVRTRENVSRAAYTVLIQNPGGETVQPRGGPCLNYIAVQLDTSPRLTLGLLAVYRSHDFLERAYGNYWGLCNLLRFMASEVNAAPGPLTCVSSRLI